MRSVTLAAGIAALCSSGTAWAQAGQDMPPMPKPGPEHEILKADVGVWDAVVEMFMAPGQPPATSKGVETNTLMGGLWLVTEFKGDMMGSPFEGRGMSGYDSLKKKYVGTWVDTMSVGIATVESTYDAATKTLSGTMEAPDMTGKVSRMKETVVYKDPNTRVFTMFNTGPDGKDVPTMRITYTRRK
jgi:hypothetical protein